MNGKEMNGKNFATELKYFQEMWENRPFPKNKHTVEIWEERAAEWIKELESGNGKSDAERVDATASYLRNRGLLGEDTTVVDIGCGPGLFVAEFAKTAKHVTGIDFSKRFTEYGTELAASNQISNVSFKQYDMTAVDIKSAGLYEAFDLVFSSIVPIVTSKGSLQKIMEMSRAICCNVSFVYLESSLLDRVSKDVFDGKARPRHDGMGFYTMFNYLLLSGYYPETYYFTVEATEIVPPVRASAENIAFNLKINSAQDTEKILRYLEKHGEIENHTVYRYGSILWDKRLRDSREFKVA